MLDRSWSDLAGTQASTLRPLVLNLSLCTVAFYPGFIVRLKHRLPGESHASFAAVQVAHIFHAFLEEGVKDGSVQHLVDFVAVGQWRLTTGLWSSETEKEEPGRP